MAVTHSISFSEELANPPRWAKEQPEEGSEWRWAWHPSHATSSSPRTISEVASPCKEAGRAERGHPRPGKSPSSWQQVSQAQGEGSACFLSGPHNALARQGVPPGAGAERVAEEETPPRGTRDQESQQGLQKSPDSGFSLLGGDMEPYRG